MTDAGRLTDDAFPIELIEPTRTKLSINNSKLSGQYFRKVFDRCHANLTSIDISGSFQIDDETIKYILEKCPNLASLYSRNCRKLTSKSLQSIIATDRKIIHLDIGGNINIDVKGLDQFLNTYAYAEMIEDLQISGLVISDSTMSLLIRKCKSLRLVGISYADISDQSLVRFIQSSGPKLEYLNVSWLSTTSMPSHHQVPGEKIFQALIANAPVLEELDINGMKSISGNDILLFLDTINQKSMAETGSKHPLRTVHARFIASGKSQMENMLASAYPSIKFVF